METIKKNWPLFACTGVIVLAQIGAAVYVADEVGRHVVSVNYDTQRLVDYARRMDGRTITQSELEADAEQARRALETLGGGKQR